ncbi:MAG: tol-pal system protein YbgF [Bradyrhizobiaceae bacterium]|nr:MAG: tol-pal system protein YbgF [Bradyrhizobiaceae bacterium]
MSPKFPRHIALAVFLAAACLPLRAGAQGFGGQQGDEDPDVRIDRLENQLRTLTGQNEELQHRNQVLEEQLRALQGGAPGGQAPAAQAARPGGPPPQQQSYQQPPYQQQPSYQAPQGQPPSAVNQGQPNYQGGQGYNQGQSYNNGGQPAPIAQAPAGGGGRRGDAFDPTQNPNAPGAPRALGGGQMPINPGAPVNLAAPSPAGGYQQQPEGYQQPGGPPAQSSASLETAPPSQTPRDEFDLGIGYMQRKDYASAEDTMRNFMQKYPSDRLVADAQYWLGESLYLRQRYRDAAESFLAVTTKYDKSGKAPDALLRLGQSLAALKEKDAACAAFGEVTRKYPRASSGVKQGAEREQKRVGC